MPEAEILAHLESIEFSVQWMMQHPFPDLLFMDIELADGQSFEIFNQIAVRCPVIFCTAYDEYALKAFKVNSIDYLLKPVEAHALKQSLEKLKAFKEQFASASTPVDFKLLLEQFSPKPNPTYKKRFLIKVGEKFQQIETEHIAYFLSEDKISFLVTHDQKRLILDNTLDELENMLDPRRFFRINKQFLASYPSIHAIHNYFNGKLKLQLAPDAKMEVLVSREKAPLLKEWLDT